MQLIRVRLISIKDKIMSIFPLGQQFYCKYAVMNEFEKHSVE